jgi:hypothetical protein
VSKSRYRPAVPYFFHGETLGEVAPQIEEGPTPLGGATALTAELAPASASRVAANRNGELGPIVREAVSLAEK